MPRTKRLPPGEQRAEGPKLRQVDPTSSVPRSLQAMRSLLEAISSGEVGPLLPNQHELAAQLGTSLSTVRQAIEMLRAEGRLVAVPSVGTYVREGPTEHDQVPEVSRRADDLDSLAASDVRSLLASHGPEEAPRRAGALAGRECWHWQWRLVGPQLEPCALVDAWSTRAFSQGAERAGSPFDLVLASRGRLERLDEVARVVAPLPAERRALSLGTHQSVLLVTSTGWAPGGEQVLHMEWALGPNMALSVSLGWR